MSSFAIRQAAPGDAAFVVALFALPHVRATAHGPASEDAFLERLLHSSQKLLIVERDGRPFGHLKFEVTEGWLLHLQGIAFAQQRTGAGTFTMSWLMQHAFRELRVHRVYLEVVEENAGARRLYERSGLREEGLMRDAFRAQDGTYRNMVVYGAIAP